jgi:soluble lytic murein transglycosylase-like protein
MSAAPLESWTRTHYIAEKEENELISHHKRPKGLKAWFKRNILWFVLLAIILFSFGAGLVVGKKVTGKSEPVLAAYVEEPAFYQIVTENEPTPSAPTPKTVIDTEPITVYFDIPLSKELQDYIRNLCDEYDVPIELVIAIIDVESSFQSDVISKTNDYGLMQINKCNHKWLTDELGVTDFLDPYQNIKSGVHILSGHLEVTNGDIELALMRYNNGAIGAKKLWDKGIYSTAYTKKIMAAYESYKEESRQTDSTP